MLFVGLSAGLCGGLWQMQSARSSRRSGGNFYGARRVASKVAVGAVRGAISWSSQIGFLGASAYDGWFGAEPGDKRAASLERSRMSVRHS